MSSRPHVLIQGLPGGGVALAVEFPAGVPPGPVVLSAQLAEDLIIELTGRHPIPGHWVRLPAVYLGTPDSALK